MVVADKKIDYRFKILYAVAIIMVCCGHAEGGGISILSDWFPYDGFHLALFTFASGYFYSVKSEENTGQYIKRKLLKLIVPLYMYILVYGVSVQLLKIKGFTIGGDLSVLNVLLAPFDNNVQYYYIMGGWYIAPLFMVQVYNVLIRKVLKRINNDISENVFFVINLAVGIVGNQLACMNYINEWSIVFLRVLYLVPFYGLGIYYKNILEKYDKKIPSFQYFCILFFLKLLIIYYYGKMPTYIASLCKDFSEGPIMPIVIGYLGIALWMRIAIILEPIIGRSKWINLIADNTYSIMMNHFLGFMIVKTIYAFINKMNWGCYDFDWLNYKTNIWWYYKPKGISHTLIIYVVFGIVFSIIIKKCINLTKNKMKKTTMKNK